jgi:hypothetical protein
MGNWPFCAPHSSSGRSLASTASATGSVRPTTGWASTAASTPDGGMDTASPIQCECLCLFTRGLSRFGLPDLVIDRVPCDYDLAATNAMRGLAVRLLTLLWANPDAHELRLNSSIAVDPEDVWAYWSARPLFGLPVPLRLTHATRDDLPAAATHLELHPRLDYPGTRPEWAAHVLNQGASSVAGWQPDTPPYRIDRQVAYPHATAATKRQDPDHPSLAGRDGQSRQCPDRHCCHSTAVNSSAASSN